VLVYYAVYKEYIGFYPTPNPIVHFKKETKKTQHLKRSNSVSHLQTITIGFDRKDGKVRPGHKSHL
jgi:uncharacterized protein YdhG (YjbR/CyaY superfamily)